MVLTKLSTHKNFFMEGGASTRPLWHRDVDSTWDANDDQIVLWEPVRPTVAPLWRSPEIRDQPPASADMANYTTRQIAGVDHVEVLSWIAQGFGVLNYERIGDAINYDWLELTVRVEAPTTPTFDGDVITVGVFWDRTYPPSLAPQPIARYFESSTFFPPIRPTGTLAEVELLWAKDFVMDEPRYNAITNPVRPQHQTHWVERINIDLRGLRARFSGPSITFGSVGPGALIFATKAAIGGLALSTLGIYFEWRLFFDSAKVQNC